MNTGASEFRSELVRLRARYRERLAGFVRDAGRREADALEAQLRVWLVDGFLKCLGWRGFGLTDEYPVDRLAGSSEKRWRLDYLGHTRDDDGTVPLLVVGTKRPSSPLPEPGSAEPVFHGYSKKDLLVAALRENVVLAGDWADWLTKARGYVARLVHQHGGACPSRLVITNGDWFVLILNPRRCLLEQEADTDDVVVYRQWAEVEDGHRRMFDELHYDQLLAPLVPEELIASQVSRVFAEAPPVKMLRGLRVAYRHDSDTLRLEPAPELKVWPILFMKAVGGRWFQVRLPPPDGSMLIVPHRYERLPEHLADVEEEAGRLLESVRAALGSALPEVSELGEHLADHADQIMVPPRRELHNRDSPSNHFLLALGRGAHFLRRASPQCRSCPFHDVGACPHDHRVPHVLSRSVTGRSFFKTGEHHACAHSSTRSAKEPAPTSTSRFSDARCHIWYFDTGICCRACAFEPVCAQGRWFGSELPCPQPAAPGGGGDRPS